MTIEDHYCWSGNTEFYNFKAHEINADCPMTDPTGAHDGKCYYWWSGDVEDGSWWWYQLPLYQQTYNDYEKLFSYEKTTVTNEESTTQVSEGNGITNVRHLVKYVY